MLAREAAQTATSGAASRANAAVIAVALHGWYNAAEQTLERIAVAFEGEVPRGPNSQRELLREMTLDLGAIRIAVVRPETEEALAELLRFRNFFRHAYAVALHWDRLLANVTCVERAHRLLAQDLDEFAVFLRNVAPGVESSS